MENVGLFDLLDITVSEYLEIPVQVYLEKVEQLSFEEMDTFGELFTEYLRGGNTKEEMLEILKVKE